MERIGNQEPTIHFSLPYSQTEGQDAVDLYELTGRNALEWQQILVKDILAKLNNTPFLPYRSSITSCI